MLVGWNETGSAGGGASLARSELWRGAGKSRLEGGIAGSGSDSRPMAGETSSRGANSRGESGRLSVSDIGAGAVASGCSMDGDRRNGRAAQRPATMTPTARKIRDVFTMRAGSARVNEHFLLS